MCFANGTVSIRGQVEARADGHKQHRGRVSLSVNTGVSELQPSATAGSGAGTSGSSGEEGRMN